MAERPASPSLSPPSPPSPRSSTPSPHPSPPSPTASSTSPPGLARPKRDRKPPQPYALERFPSRKRPRSLASLNLDPTQPRRRRRRKKNLPVDDLPPTPATDGEDGGSDSDGTAGSDSTPSPPAAVEPPVKRKRGRPRKLPPPVFHFPATPASVLIRVRKRLLKVRGPDGKFKNNLWVYDLLSMKGAGVPEVTPRARIHFSPERSDSASPSVGATPPTANGRGLHRSPEVDRKPAVQPEARQPRVTAQAAAVESAVKSARPMVDVTGNGAGDDEADGAEVELDDSAEVTALLRHALDDWGDGWSFVRENGRLTQCRSFHLRQRVQALDVRSKASAGTVGTVAGDERWYDGVVIAAAGNAGRFAWTVFKMQRAEALNDEAEKRGGFFFAGLDVPLTETTVLRQFRDCEMRRAYLVYFDHSKEQRWYLEDAHRSSVERWGDHPLLRPRPAVDRGKEEKVDDPPSPPQPKSKPIVPPAIDTTRDSSFPAFNLSTSTFGGLLSPRDGTGVRQPPATFPPSPPPATAATWPAPMTGISTLPSFDLQLAQVRSGTHPLILQALSALQVKTEERRRVAERRRVEGLKLVEEEYKADMKEVEEEWREEWKAVEDRVLEEVRERRREERGDELGMAGQTRRKKAGMLGWGAGGTVRPVVRRRFHLEQRLTAGERKADVERARELIVGEMGEEGKARLQRIERRIKGRVTWGGQFEFIKKTATEVGPVVETRLRRRG